MFGLVRGSIIIDGPRKSNKGYNGDIKVCNINDGSFVSLLRGHTSYVYDIIQISNSNILVSSSGDCTIRIWNLTTNSIKFILRGHTNDVFGLRQINSEILSSASYDSTVKLWNITNGQLIRTLSKNQTGYITGLTLDLMNDANGGQSSSSIMLSGSYGLSFKLWNLTSGETLKTAQTYSNYIFALAVIGVYNQTQQQQQHFQAKTPLSKK